MKVIIYKQESGSVAVMYPACDCELSVEEIARKDVPEGCIYKIVDEENLPKVNIYFDSWVYSWPITINPQKAHEQKRAEMRRLREPILKRLDIEFMKNLELGLPTSEIAAKKQELREVTDVALPAFLTSDTVDSFSKRLSEFRPACLDY